MSNDPDPFVSTPPESPVSETLREGLQDYAVITLDTDGRIVQWSSGAEKSFGYGAEEVLGQSFALLFTPEDQATNQPAGELSRAIAGGYSEDERWHVRKDGTRVWISGVVRALRNDQGELNGFSKIARDITPQKLAQLQQEALLSREQAARREAEQRWKHLEEISENVPAIIALVRLPEQVYVFANRMFREALGNRPLIGRRFREAVPEADPQYFEIFDTVAATGQSYSASGRRVSVRGPDGQITEGYFDFIFQPMRSEAGQYEAILIFAVDVSERVRGRHASEQLTQALQAEGGRLKIEIAERRRAEDLAEERAAKLEEQAALLDLAQDAILSLRLDGTIDFWNRGAEEMYGWSRAEALGRNVHELLQTQFPRPLEEIRAALLQEGQWTGELKQTARRGATLELSSRWVLHRRGDEPAGWLEINRDVTERQRLEAHLREAQKLESLGVLAGGIAHDFNNLLTGVIGNISLALDMAERESPLHEVLAGSLRASERAAFLTRQMLAYAGKGQFVIQFADLSAVVSDTMALAGGSIPGNVRVELKLAGGLPPVRADITQLQQVAMNLVLNAAEAIGEQPGKVVVRTGLRDLDAGAAAAAYDVGQPSPGPYVALEVRDTGAGIDPSVRPKIFDPFFSTKFTGRGLGLAAVSGIVRALRGAVRVHSAEGHGTTFEVLLPAGTEGGTSAPPEKPTVLVVDDEEIVRRTAEAMLLSRGYRVLLAENGQEAVDLFRERQAEIAAVLLDTSMPVMGGEEALREIQSIRPEVPVIVSSGYTEEEALRRFGGVGVAGFIQKPYTLKELTEKMAGVVQQD